MRIKHTHADVYDRESDYYRDLDDAVNFQTKNAPITTSVSEQENLAEDTTYPVHILGDCTNAKCNEDIYAGDYVEFGGQFYCNEFCLGVHLISEGRAVDMRNGY